MKTKISKHDEYIEEAKNYCHYVDTTRKTIGVFSTPEDALKANNSIAVKSLKNKFKYHIQMVIK